MSGERKQTIGRFQGTQVGWEPPWKGEVKGMRNVRHLEVFSDGQGVSRVEMGAGLTLKNFTTLPSGGTGQSRMDAGPKAEVLETLAEPRLTPFVVTWWQGGISGDPREGASLRRWPGWWGVTQHAWDRDCLPSGSIQDKGATIPASDGNQP